MGKARLYTWGLAQISRYGWPDVALGFLGGIGDDLLCTAPIEELLARGARRIWFFTRHPQLYSHFDRRVQLVPEDARLQQLVQRLGRPMRALSYSSYDHVTDRDSSVTEHIIVEMCRRAQLTGRIRLRPHVFLRSDELAWAEPWADCIAIQSSSLTASVPMLNKQWNTDRLQAIVRHFEGRFRFVQIGSSRDPALPGSSDLRGKTSLRETAAVLARARLFVGTAGFLMHLARAVECPAVIVYGGREPPELTGYSCNSNVAHRPPCAPCWQRNRCNFSHVCMDGITTAEVITAIESALARPRGPLAEDRAQL